MFPLGSHHSSLTAECESRVKAKVASGLSNNASEVIREVKLAQLREQLKVGTDQLDRGEGIAIASKAVLDSLFDDVKG